MQVKLPAWVVDDAASVRAEAAPYRDMTPEKRGELLASACRAAARMLRARADGARAAEYRDPLPESSKLALARLRGARSIR
ncbi:MAG: hypothetical protein WCJ30_05660 [Deltaproteobacteria bacterium]